jgi:hypothetical protein
MSRFIRHIEPEVWHYPRSLCYNKRRGMEVVSRALVCASVRGDACCRQLVIEERTCTEFLLNKLSHVIRSLTVFPEMIGSTRHAMRM